MGTGEVSFLPPVAGLPVERGGGEAAADSEAVMLRLETPAPAGPIVFRRQTTVTFRAAQESGAEPARDSLGVSHTCTADPTPTRGGILRAELPPGTTASSSLPPPAATPEPALSEALQGGDRVTRLSASGRAIASGGAPSPAKVLVVLTMGALRPPPPAPLEGT